MNKKDFIDRLAKETGYSKDKCKKVNDVIESRLIIGKNNRKKMLSDISSSLDIDLETASDIYDKCIFILGNEFKNKIKHPFKSKK